MSTNEWGQEVAAGDELPPEEKLAANPDFTSWYDLVCSVCQTHCCVNCTANGNYRQCSKTMFSNCSVCGHSSSAHYAAPH